MNAGFMPVINKSDLIVSIELITQCEHSHVLADILHPIGHFRNELGTGTSLVAQRHLGSFVGTDDRKSTVFIVKHQEV